MLNRAALESRAGELACQPGQIRQEVGVIVLDIDRFKVINDRHGHTVGDEVLSKVARRLRGKLRATDSGYRVGGEEFVILLPGARGPQLLETASSRPR